MHVQNVDRWEDWLAALERDELPLGRALPVTPKELLIREMILQMKRGRLDVGYFRNKFATDIREEFAQAWRGHEAEGDLTVGKAEITLTRKGLLHVDALLPAFFEPQHRGTRYT
jgi:oxygen-independent coproporphyrinogen-3 oxidase